jgi:hypothetical protein
MVGGSVLAFTRALRRPARAIGLSAKAHLRDTVGLLCVRRHLKSPAHVQITTSQRAQGHGVALHALDVFRY